MNVLIIGKARSIVHWYEYTVSAFKESGHTVHPFAFNGLGPIERISYNQQGRTADYEQILIQRAQRLLAGKRVDLCLSVSTYWLPQSLLRWVRNTFPGCMNIGWVGDKFAASLKDHAATLDKIYYTDSSFVTDHARYGFASAADYMPHAVDPRHFTLSERTREKKMLFVANGTKHRAQVVNAITHPIKIRGRGWRPLTIAPLHTITRRRLPAWRLPSWYGRFMAVLNVSNELNVVDGLNQRSFEPFACGTPVVHEHMRDLERCFDIGTEVFAYTNSQQLNEIYNALLADPSLGQKVGQRGYQRVLHEHTYQQRVSKILRDLGLS